MEKQTLEQMLSAMDDSVAYINECVGQEIIEEDWRRHTPSRIRRNRDHLVYSLALDDIIGAGLDLSFYEQAITSANQLLGE